MTGGSARRLRPLVPAGLALAAAIFVVPYALPPDASVKSASAIAGFNNSLAYALYVPVLAVAAWVLTQALALKDELVVLQVGAWSWPPATVWLIGLAHAAGFFLLYAFKGRFVFAEGLYFQHVAFRVAAGEAPYTSVSFLYGPAAIYPIAWLARFMPLTAAYALYYVVIYLVGLYTLYVALRWLLPGHRDAGVPFILLSIGFFNPLTGLNYTFVRHLLPTMSVLTAWRYARSGGGRNLLVGGVTLWLATMYSADVGLVSVAGVVVLGAFRYGPDLLARSGLTSAPGTRSLTAPTPLGFLALPVLALSPIVAVFALIPPRIISVGYYLDVLRRFSAGGSNTPVEVSVPMLVLVGLTLIAAAGVVGSLRSRGLEGDGAAFAALLVMLVMMERAAFGKPDVVHIAFAGLPVLILCLGVAPHVGGGPRARVWLLLAFTGLVIPLQYFHASLFVPFMTARLSLGQPSDGTVSSPTVREQLERLVTDLGPDRPYYMHNLMYYSFPVYARFGLRHAGYFTTPEEAFTDGDIQSQLRDLVTRGAAVIVSRKDLDAPSLELASRRSPVKAAINALAAAPLPGSRVHREATAALRDLWRPFLDYVERCYEVAARTADLLAFVPRAAARPPSCAASAPAG